MEVKLNFYLGEMREFLSRHGYKIEKVKSWHSYTVYHNDVEIAEDEVEIAYMERPSEKDLDKDKNHIESLCGIEHVFQNVLSQKLLNL